MSFMQITISIILAIVLMQQIQIMLLRKEMKVRIKRNGMLIVEAVAEFFEFKKELKKHGKNK